MVYLMFLIAGVLAGIAAAAGILWMVGEMRA